MEMLIVFLVAFVGPLICAYFIAKERNRNVIKSILVAVCLGWLGVIGLLCFLKKRDKATGFLK